MHVQLLTILLGIGFRLNTSSSLFHMISPWTRKTNCILIFLVLVDWNNSARNVMSLHSGIFLLIPTKIAFALNLSCCVEIIVNKAILTIALSSNRAT
jgi:hypothetical protein